MADQGQGKGRRERRGRRRQQREAQEAQRRKRYMIGGAIIGVFLLIAVGVSVAEYFENDDDDVDAFPSVQAAEAGYDEIPSEPYFLGDPDAPVHLIEWSDYQ